MVTIAAGRARHLALQRAGLAAGTARPDLHAVALMDPEQQVSGVDGLTTATTTVPVPPTGLPLAAARNAGAALALDAGAELLVFLDVDCVPATALLQRYAAAAATHPGALLAGPVAYLDPPPPGGYRLDSLAGTPHPARPVPPDGEVVAEERTELFWSLSFAVTADAWRRTGGFHPGYSGYGAEDTDFALVARAAGVGLHWVGGALAHHQHHGPSGATTAHAADIVRNAHVFHDRHGWWPMSGWLAELAATGVVTFDPAAGVCALGTVAGGPSSGGPGVDVVS